MSGFDYGHKLPDGQYERHPQLPEDKRVKLTSPEHLKYSVIIHKGGVKPCKRTTQMPLEVTESLLTDPNYYRGMFCIVCGAYFSIDQFVFWKNGQPLTNKQEI